MTVTFLAAVDRHFAEHWSGTKDGEKSRRRALAFAEHPEGAPFRDEPCAAIFVREKAFQFRDAQRAANKSPGTINRHVAAFCAVWRACHRRGEVPTPPPSGLYLREGPGRKRVVLVREFDALVEHLQPEHAALATVLFCSGLRVSEALALRWEDWNGGPHTPRYLVDAVAWALSLRDTKNGDDRVVPIGEDANEALLTTVDPAWPQRSGPFTNVTQRAFNRDFARAARKLGVTDPDFCPHALRHSYATRIVAAGVPLLVAARILGHRSTRTTERYAHVDSGMALDSLRKAGII